MAEKDYPGVTLADMEESAVNVVTAELNAKFDSTTRRYRTKYPEVQEGADGALYLNGLRTPEAQILEWLWAKEGNTPRCLLCHLGVADIHEATRAAGLKYGR